jgi:predicted regulator of Ras-like GTPase activity (Roadblock/LC7/MglB family)
MVGQLIYTTLPNSGFQLLVSQRIPIHIQDSFVQNIVYQHWNVYNPPSDDYQAVYLHQVSATHLLFGWLYNEGRDELGRSHIPYFLAYYWTGNLDDARLERFLRHLEKGPVYFIERERLESNLQNVIVPDVDEYNSPRSGLVISSEIRVKSQKDLQKKKILKLLVASDDLVSPEPVSDLGNVLEITDVPYLELTAETTEISEKLTVTEKKSQVTAPTELNSSQVEQIFEDVVQEGMGIEGAILISDEGRSLTRGIGLDESQALIMAGRMLALAKKSQTEMQWQDWEAIAAHSSDGHLMLTPCLPDVFLFVQASHILTGLLEVEIKRMIKKIQSIHQNNEMFVPFSPLWDDLEDEMSEVLADSDEQILYRGRRMSF